MTKVYEVNFDGLIGPTHNFAGLAVGNLASQSHKYAVSHPKKAALQGLAKMKLVHSLGVKQGFIPPQERPNIHQMRKRGFSGSDQEVLEKCAKEDFNCLLECTSASAMWAANAATVSPSSDSNDHRLHITPANLKTHPHRSLESEQTAKILKIIFPEEIFSHHPPLSTQEDFFDEGAANHMRLCKNLSSEGLEIFVYGKSDQDISRLPSRQSLNASQAIAHNHQIKEGRVLFVQQNPDAIDKGVFHNDVIAVSNENVLLYHEEAFVNTKEVIQEMQSKYGKITGQELHCIEIKTAQLMVEGAVASYLFNSQIVSRPDGKMSLIAPEECDQSKLFKLLDELITTDNPIDQAHFVPLHESMANGGGPACLRLRVAVTEEELKSVHSGFLLDEQKFAQLEKWINKFFRDELEVEELGHPDLLDQSRAALDELTQLLQLGPIYDFQKR